MSPKDGVRIRYNYTFQKGGGLHALDLPGARAPPLASKKLSEGGSGGYDVDESSEGEVYMRVERQGLRKLPGGAVLCMRPQ